ncbi:hypothetical protein RFI_01610 [Reticulomyxa filosa]|uniref:Uncharacterized protein n=1 Tax=Reticulomyxa filosa TaxID=46433 RepID=X6PAA3_RETFI|nr:hypothetical protein RFI_01610 [Reticulomyxa filosa]|eukprot:ETO35455.1 hypothetical protein RFI_01610 [Reticulomyxa filosa]
MSEIMKKGHDFIRSLSIQFAMPHYRVNEYPSFSNLFHLDLQMLQFDTKISWVNLTKMPRLRYISIVDLTFESSGTGSNSELFENISTSNIFDSDINNHDEKNSVETNQVFTAGDEKIEFVNSILDACPNILALFWNFAPWLSDIESEGTLHIPASLEWLLLRGIPSNKFIDLSQCKSISGINFCDIWPSSVKWPIGRSQKIGCACIELGNDEYSVDTFEEWDTFFSSQENWHVQLYLTAKTNIIYDFSYDQLFLPTASTIDSKISGRQGLYFADAMQMWLLNDSLQGRTQKELLFLKLVNPKHLQEYETWFDINCGNWIRYLGDFVEPVLMNFFDSPD